MPPIQKLAQLLLAKSSRMATAESCTGGLLAAQLTALPGASLWFECALITYSNAAKECFLNVSSTTLATAGAVSEGCVLEMLAGLFTNTQASVGVAISGIAGPDGGTKDKPVGTVWFAFGIKGQKPVTQQQHFLGNRETVREAACAFAIDQLCVLLSCHSRDSGNPL